MAKLHIYSRVLALPAIYCSSSGDYFAIVTPIGIQGQTMAKRRYWINGQCFVTPRSQIHRPRYLIEMVIGTLQKLDLVIYELDWNNNPRYSDLRYGSAARLRCLLGIGGEDEIPPRGRTRISNAQIPAGTQPAD